MSVDTSTNQWTRCVRQRRTLTIEQLSLMLIVLTHTKRFRCGTQQKTNLAILKSQCAFEMCVHEQRATAWISTLYLKLALVCCQPLIASRHKAVTYRTTQRDLTRVFRQLLAFLFSLKLHSQITNSNMIFLRVLDFDRSVFYNMKCSEFMRHTDSISAPARPLVAHRY